MRSCWKAATLGECISLTSGGTPSKSNPTFWNGHIPWVSSKDIKCDRLAVTEEYVTEAALANGTKLAPAGTILLVVRSMILARQLPVTEIQRTMAFNQDIKALRPLEDVLSRFIFYWFLATSHEILGIADEAAHGTKRLQTDRLLGLPLRLPDLPTQERIVALLSTYDDLIENNTRRIAILEEMARALYQEWFVHFRFPGHEHVPLAPSPLGPIPAGWRLRLLGEVAVNFDRKRKPLSSLQRGERPGPYPYYGAAKIVDYIDDYIFDGRYLLFAEDGSVITKDGYPVLQRVNEKFWANNHTHILQGTPGASTEFLYLTLSRFPISGYMTGAAQPKITQANMNRIPLLIPPTRLMVEFSGIAAGLLQLGDTLVRANANLRTQRDLLLPKLISGEIDVSALSGEPVAEAAD